MYPRPTVSFLLTIAASSILLTYCASGSKAATDKDTAAKTFTTHETKGIVYLYRTNKAFAGGILAPIKVNGIDAGGMGPDSYFKWDLEPGQYTFSTVVEANSAVAELDVQPGKLYFLRMDYKFDAFHGAKAVIEAVDEAKGKAEVQKCNLLISTYK